MSAPPVIRRATKADLPKLGRLGALLVRTHYEFDRQRFMAPGEGTAEGYAWFLGLQLEDERVLVLVATIDDAIAGYLYAGIEPENWKELRGEAGFIHDLLVEEQARGQGIATALMDAAFAWMRDRQVPRVMLWSAAPNEAARRLFERLGFRTTMVEMTREMGDRG